MKLSHFEMILTSFNAISREIDSSAILTKRLGSFFSSVLAMVADGPTYRRLGGSVFGAAALGSGGENESVSAEDLPGEAILVAFSLSSTNQGCCLLARMKNQWPGASSSFTTKGKLFQSTGKPGEKLQFEQLLSK